MQTTVVRNDDSDANTNVQRKILKRSDNATF